MITIHKVASNVESVPRHSPDIYWHTEQYSVIPNCSYSLTIPTKWTSYRVIKKSLCTWLQHWKLQVMFKVSPRQSADTYWHAKLCSVIPNPNYVITVGDWNCLKYCIFACFLYCNRQVHRDFLITLYYQPFLNILTWGLQEMDAWHSSVLYTKSSGWYFW